MVLEKAVSGTFTEQLQQLRRWLKEGEVKQVATESAGVYWIPLWNELEGKLKLLLVNPDLPVRKVSSFRDRIVEKVG